MIQESFSVSLRDLEIFKELSIAELKSIQSCLREKSFNKDEILFFEGDHCEKVFIVQSGRVKISRVSCGGKEQILQVLEVGDTCACNPGSSDWQCFSTAQALTPCRVWFFSREQYVHLVKTNHKLTRAISRIFAKRLCWLSSLIEEISLDEPEKRIAKFILNTVEGTIDSPKDKGCLTINFTHEEISQRLGLARETVTRHLNKLKRLKFVDLKPQLIILLDKEGLQKISS